MPPVSLIAAVVAHLYHVPAVIYVPCPDELVYFVRDTGLYVGKLEPSGDFEQRERMQFPVDDKTLGIVHSWRNELPRLLNPMLGPQSQVYEFRSGLLIPGTLTIQGRFVPALGGTITRFEDYQFSPHTPGIWNLPGTWCVVYPLPPAAAPRAAVAGAAAVVGVPISLASMTFEEQQRRKANANRRPFRTKK